MQGCAQAQHNMGVMCTEGRGAEQGMPDSAAAVRWYELAAAQGHVDSMVNLALILEQGRVCTGEQQQQQQQRPLAGAAGAGSGGVAVDLGRALELYTEAASRGDGAAARAARRLRQRGGAHGSGDS